MSKRPADMADICPRAKPIFASVHAAGELDRLGLLPAAPDERTMRAIDEIVMRRIEKDEVFQQERKRAVGEWISSMSETGYTPPPLLVPSFASQVPQTLQEAALNALLIDAATQLSIGASGTSRAMSAERSPACSSARAIRACFEKECARAMRERQTPVAHAMQAAVRRHALRRARVAALLREQRSQ